MAVKMLFFVFFMLLIGKSDQSVLGVLKAVSVTVDVIGGVLDLFDSARQFTSEAENPDTMDKQELLSKIQEMTNSAKTEILTSFVIVSKTETIEKAFYTVHSLLIDLKHFFEADNQTRPTFQKAFVESYKSNNVEVYTRFLSRLLTFVIPGTSGKLLPIFIEQHRCNMTTIYEFKEFYFKLVSDGITLESVYLTLEMPLALNKTIEFWDNESRHLVKTFDTEERTCQDEFNTYAISDLKNSNNASQLWKENKQRYYPKWNDVMFFPRIGSEQTQFLKINTNSVFHEASSERNKLAIFGVDDDMWNSDYVNKMLDKSKETIRGVITGKDDEHAAKKVYDKVYTLLNDEGYQLTALIVFFEESSHKSELIFDKESSAASVIIEDVTMKYCYANSAECWISDNIWDPLQNSKTVYGKFRVYAYPASSGSENLSDTNGAAHVYGCYRLTMAVFAVLFLM